MAELSASVVNQPRSGIREVMELAGTVENVIHLEVGEPLFKTPSHIVAAGCKALEDGYTKYTPNAGMQQLRSVIADAVSKDSERRFTADNVIVGIGGVEVINNAFRVFTEPGDEVLIPDPAWPNYVTMATISNVKAIGYPLRFENRFIPDFEELEKLVTDKTRLIVVNSPSNPLGVVFDEEIMKKFVDFANRHDLYLLSDEAYNKLTYGEKFVTPLSFDTEGRVIGAYTFSKTYAMTGWRVGYVVGSEKVIAQMIKLQEAYVSSVPGSMQMAAITAMTGPQDCVEVMRKEYDEHRRIAANILDEFGIEYYMPKGAFYMWIKAGCENSKEFAKKLVMEKHVAVAPGATFGDTGEGFIRISIASGKEDLEIGVRKLAEAISAFA